MEFVIVSRKEIKSYLMFNIGVLTDLKKKKSKLKMLPSDTVKNNLNLSLPLKYMHLHFFLQLEKNNFYELMHIHY